MHNMTGNNRMFVKDSSKVKQEKFALFHSSPAHFSEELTWSSASGGRHGMRPETESCGDTDTRHTSHPWQTLTPRTFTFAHTNYHDDELCENSALDDGGAEVRTDEQSDILLAVG
jgi:hypothetical protein